MTSKSIHQWHKSVFSLLIAMAMVFSILPISAFASDDVQDAIVLGDSGVTTPSTSGGLLLTDGGEDDPDALLECDCEIKCTEDAINAGCPVCAEHPEWCVVGVDVPEIAPLAPAALVEVISVGGYVTTGNGEITISGLPSDGIYLYLITADAWPNWQNTSQMSTANMTIWSIWTGSVDSTTSYDGTALNNGATYYVYIAKAELTNFGHEMRSIGEAVVTLSTLATPATTSSSSGSSSGSSKKEKPAPAAPAIAPMDDKSSGTLNNAIDSAASAATNSNGKDLGVTLKNVSNFTKENAAAILKKAKALGKKATVSSDIMSEDGRSVEVRVTVDPELITKTVRLDGYTRQSQTLATESKFKKHFENKTAVVSLAQEGKFGQTAKIAAKVDLSGFDSDNLYFYSYDKNTNQYVRIDKPAYRIDKKGYLHFETDNGGDIIISNGKLKKK